MAEEKTNLQKSEAKHILQLVWEKIQSNDFDDGKTTTDILNDLNVTQDMYEQAFQTITAKQSVVLQRNPNELWTNQYNPYLPKCWDANMDIQFVFGSF